MLKNYAYLFKIKIKIRPLCIFLSKISAYRRDFDETKYMSWETF